MTTAKVPVDTDTRQAKADLRELNTNRARARKRASAAVKRTSRMATRAFAFTGAASAVGKFKNNEPTANVDMIAEALTPYYAKASEMMDNQLGYSAKARRSAREQTKAAFAYHVGKTGQTAGMRGFFNTVNQMQSDVESGRHLVRQDPRFIGVDPGSATKAAIKGNLALFLKNLSASNPAQALTQGFDYIIEGLNAE